MNGNSCENASSNEIVITELQWYCLVMVVVAVSVMNYVYDSSRRSSICM